MDTIFRRYNTVNPYYRCVMSMVGKGRNISGRFPETFHGKLHWGILEIFKTQKLSMGIMGTYGN